MTKRAQKHLFYISQNYSYAILRPIQEELLKLGLEVKWFLEGEEVNPSYLKSTEPRLKSVKEVKEWRPDIVFVPGNYVPSFIPGIKVALFHGFNSGKIRKGRIGHFDIRGCFDLYCTQGPDTTLKFKELANKYKYFEVKETGWSTLDPLFEFDNSPSNNNKPTILFCSTFTPAISCAEQIFESMRSITKNNNFKWIFQFHPKMDPGTIKKYKSLQSDNVKFIETDDVIPILKEADAMLCDTSSIISMFLLQRKPVVTFKNQGEWNHLININNSHDIVDSLKYALSRPNDLMSKIDAYCNKIHPYTDGKSSIRVINAANEIFNKAKKTKKKKPLNFMRNIKSRLKLNYWGL
ncbi:UDP-N-acetylglucosamine 2-epimerase [Vibrio inusitatus]|uniref:UDP-N-acetylglucosamine 2-epimerase n=1 Tax=Vibrio inusitatus TaxID=413402 RepID=UPI001FCB08B4|nr:UDP-N-acetylglucosamine 2-epimerase [Vibrio inusitatus]